MTHPGLYHTRCIYLNIDRIVGDILWEPHLTLFTTGWLNASGLQSTRLACLPLYFNDQNDGSWISHSPLPKLRLSVDSSLASKSPHLSISLSLQHAFHSWPLSKPHNHKNGRLTTKCSPVSLELEFCPPIVAQSNSHGIQCN